MMPVKESFGNGQFGRKQMGFREESLSFSYSDGIV